MVGSVPRAQLEPPPTTARPVPGRGGKRAWGPGRTLRAGVAAVWVVREVCRNGVPRQADEPGDSARRYDQARAGQRYGAHRRHRQLSVSSCQVRAGPHEDPGRGERLRLSRQHFQQRRPIQVQEEDKLRLPRNPRTSTAIGCPQERSGEESSEASQQRFRHPPLAHPPQCGDGAHLPGP